MTSPPLMELRRDSDFDFPELEDIHLQTRSRTFVVVVVLFATFVLAGLFFLCSRWICRSGRNSRASVVSSHPLARSRRTPLRRRQGLDRPAINALPVSIIGTAEVEATECSICLGVFEDGDKVKVLPPCEHCYHCECVDRWLSSEPSCPICRASLRVEPELTQIVTQ